MYKAKKEVQGSQVNKLNTTWQEGFRIVRQTPNINWDIVDEHYIKNDQGKLMVDDNDINNSCREYYNKILNKQIDLDSNLGP